MQKHRDELVKGRRRAKLWDILQARREEFQEKIREEEKEEFKKYYGEINE